MSAPAGANAEIGMLRSWARLPRGTNFAKGANTADSQGRHGKPKTPTSPLVKSSLLGVREWGPPDLRLGAGGLCGLLQDQEGTEGDLRGPGCCLRGSSVGGGDPRCSPLRHIQRTSRHLHSFQRPRSRGRQSRVQRFYAPQTRHLWTGPRRKPPGPRTRP